MAADIPLYHELLWPILQAVLELGGSASIGEIVETVIKGEGLSDGQQAVLHNDGPGTELAYRLGWARTYLKGMGLLTNSVRGVWALTDEGTALVTDTALTGHQRTERIQELRGALPDRPADRAQSQALPRRRATQRGRARGRTQLEGTAPGAADEHRV